jgi:hypothetical protein
VVIFDWNVKSVPGTVLLNRQSNGNSQKTIKKASPTKNFFVGLHTSCQHDGICHFVEGKHMMYEIQNKAEIGCYLQINVVVSNFIVAHPRSKKLDSDEHEIKKKKKRRGPEI